MEKLHFGLLCNHISIVSVEGIAYKVECCDGCVDICCECFKIALHIDDMNNPYPNRLSPYWYNGTMYELLVYLNNLV